ncbi:MAG: VCBS repeat-containing protein [Cellvibrio sp.]|nr:VCBS repeat-containing protein [Cellvibrio sp.]
MVNPNGNLLFTTLIDLNGDGIRDALTYARNVAAPVHAFINNKTGAFVWDDTIFIGGAPIVDNPAAPLIADFNNDNLPDFLFPNAGYDGEPYPGAAKLLLFGTADHRLENVTVTHLNLQTAPVYASAVGDLDGDFRPDVFLAKGKFGTGTKQARYWLNRSSVLESYTPTFK